MNTLEIVPAEHGGFIVLTGSRYSDAGRFSPPLFAGSLADCLEFMRDRLSAPKDSTHDVRRAA
jgi:hypothetical protein